MIADAVTKSEVETEARRRYGGSARVFRTNSHVLNENNKWWCLVARGEIIGFRRSLGEMPALIQRGRLPRDLLKGK